MELAEEMKTCISLAQTLNSEAQNMPENCTVNKKEAMQHLGNLLASNCEKICIGPSFHLYAPEGTIPASVKPPEMSDNTIRNSTEVIVEEDEEDYETIIYQGRSIIDETNSTCQNNANAIRNGFDKSDSINCTPAQASAHALVSPYFVRKNFSISSCTSPSVPSSGSRRRSDLSASQLEHTSKQTALKLPFDFPRMATKECYKQSHFQGNLSHLRERVEMIDDIKKNIEETTWEDWPKKYIEESGFCLGIEPGIFYKSRRGPFFYVSMPHRSSYEILVTNNKQIPCDVDVYVDGKLVAALRLAAGVSNSIDGPMYSEFAFKLFRSKDAPPHLGIVEGNHENGIIKAIFKPQKVEAFEEAIYTPCSKNYAIHKKKNEEEIVCKKFIACSARERELKSSRRQDEKEVVEGITVLQGIKKKQHFLPAPQMEIDVSKQVVLILRLVASTKEEVEASNEKVSSLEPPPIPSRR